jgi:hypothetical protein
MGSIGLVPLGFKVGWWIAAVACVLTLLGACWFRWAFVHTVERYSTIVLRYRKDAPGFWQRNADHLAVALVSVVLTGIVTVLITWYFAGD